MKLERKIRQYYRFSNLAEFGKIGLLVFVFVILAGIFGFVINLATPTDKELVDQEQMLEVDPLHVRGNDAYFRHFMEAVRNNDGVLIMGTSESGPIEGYNYWELLNDDPEIKTDFSILYGAGRFCSMYIPSMLNEPDLWKGQEVIVFINPVYWKPGLDTFNLTYQERYLDHLEIKKARVKSGEDIERFDLMFAGGADIDRLQFHELLNEEISQHVRSLYSGSLHGFIYGRKERNDFTPFVNVGKEDFEGRINSSALKVVRSEIDTVYNCLPTFLSSPDFALESVDPGSIYRNTSLSYFDDVAKRLDVRVTYIIGPYNRMLGEKIGVKDAIESYDRLAEELTLWMKSRGNAYIDLSDLSELYGVFNDKQHNGKYGGYLIYQRIKKYLNEKVAN